MRVIELDIPAEDPPNFGEDWRIVQQLEKCLIASDEVEDILRVMRADALGSPLFGVDAIYGGIESG